MSGASELPERTLRWLQERNVFVAEEQDRGRCLKAARRFEAGTILFANRTVSFLVQKKKKMALLFVKVLNSSFSCTMWIQALLQLNYTGELIFLSKPYCSVLSTKYLQQRCSECYQVHTLSL
jgi:uncharacterized protein (DUF1919 family)